MSNHVYSFDGKVYKQTSGGAIGLRLTGVVARICMDRWAKELTRLLEENKVKVYLLIKYVDDVNFFLEAIAPGSRWVGGKIATSKQWEEEDKEAGLTKDRATMNVIHQMCESINSWMKFTVDLEEDHEDGRIPMLDF